MIALQRCNIYFNLAKKKQVFSSIFYAIAKDDEADVNK